MKTTNSTAFDEDDDESNAFCQLPNAMTRPHPSVDNKWINSITRFPNRTTYQLLSFTGRERVRPSFQTTNHRYPSRENGRWQTDRVPPSLGSNLSQLTTREKEAYRVPPSSWSRTFQLSCSFNKKQQSGQESTTEKQLTTMYHREPTTSQD
jgi:hypothetical protein